MCGTLRGNNIVQTNHFSMGMVRCFLQFLNDKSHVLIFDRTLHHRLMQVFLTVTPHVSTCFRPKKGVCVGGGCTCVSSIFRVLVKLSDFTYVKCCALEKITVLLVINPT